MPVMKQLRIGSETYDTVGEASVTQVQTSGTKIATVTIDGTATDLYAPEGGSSVDPASAAPSMDGTAAVGTSAKYAREDHVHPTDTSKQDTLVSGTNIKTVNGESILGSGDLSVGGGGSSNGMLITMNYSSAALVADKTAQEIYDALEAGVMPVVKITGDYRPLTRVYVTGTKLELEIEGYSLFVANTMTDYPTLSGSSGGSND